MHHAPPTGLPDFDSLWDYDQPAQTEERFREILPAAHVCGDRDYHLQLLTQIARAQGLQHKFDAAHATLDHVRELMTADGTLMTARVRYLLERGRCHNDAGQRDKARGCFQEAWDLARAHRLDGHAVDAAHMIAIVETDPDEALAWNLRAMEYAGSSADPAAQRWLASLQNNIGWTYHKMGKYADALAVFEDALRLRQQQGKPGPIRIARWCVAKMHRLLGDVNRALADQESLLGECERTGESDGYVHEELAECLLATGDDKDAKPHFARAFQLLSKDPGFPADERDRLERMKRFGGIA
ncbi:MAG TPA: tetratricopeptide repeat protein [Tepidisphaeraceae bacterium]|jgi:tetratricopeptide (TPR) repeat protein